jgi:hypothetical protein
LCIIFEGIASVAGTALSLYIRITLSFTCFDYDQSSQHSVICIC